MIKDFGPALNRPRRSRWQRSPRVVVAGILTAVVGSVALGGTVYGALSVGQPAQVRVQPGDSLWSIAAAHYQGGDPRDHVDQIITLNHLGDSSITPGEVLLLPAA